MTPASGSREVGARPRPRHAALRRTLAAIAAFLAVLALLASTVGVWAHRTLLDTETYVKTVSKLARDPDVINAIADKLTDETMSLLEIDRRVRESLPEEYRFLSAPLTDATRSQVKQWLVKLMETEKFRQIWVSANRVAHKTVVGVLRNDLRYFDTSGGEVRVDLVLIAADAIREIGRRISFVAERAPIPEISSDATPDEVRAQVGAALGIAIPEGFGEVTVLRSDELADAQRAVAKFDRLVVQLVVLTLLLSAAAIAISTRRCRMLIALGIGAVFAAAAASSWIRDARAGVESAIADRAVRAAVGAVVAAFAESLSTWFRSVMFLGLALAAVGFIGGQSAPARHVRRRARDLWHRRAGGAERLMALPESGAVRWIRTHSAALRAGGLCVALAAVVVLSLSVSTLLVVLALLGAYELVIWVLDRDEAVLPDENEPANERDAAASSGKAGALNP